MKTIVAGALILIAAGPALQTGRAGDSESVALQASPQASPVAAFDVRAYGAKGDGKTLDTDTIDNIRIDTNRDGLTISNCVFEYSRSLAIEIRGRVSDTVSVLHGV